MIANARVLPPAYLLAVILSVVPVSVFSAGQEAGADSAIQTNCHSCHGYDGVTKTESWPNLACQNRGYLYSRMMHFRHSKDHDIDKRVKALSSKEINEIADYYASQPCPRPR